MIILTILASIALLLILMVFIKLDTFFSLLIATLFLGVVNGVPLLEILDIIESGVGNQLGHLILVIGLGAILGKLLEESGATSQIAHYILKFFGESKANIAILVIAFIIGLPLFFEVGFILLIPIVYTLVKELNVPLLHLGLPMAVALSATHSFLPPHPGPLTVTNVFEANLGFVLLYGIAIAIPAIIITGYFFPKLKWIKNIETTIPEGLVNEKELNNPLSFLLSLSVILLPIFLITLRGLFESLSLEAVAFYKVIKILGESTVALFIAIVYIALLMMSKQQRSLKNLQVFVEKGFVSVAMIMIIIGAGGAFKEMIVHLEIASYLESYLKQLSFSPYLLAWLITAILRFSVGSATVTVMMSSAITMPLLAVPNVSPELLVLAVTTGSVALSHVNDPGFWMYKQYFNLSIQDAIKSRTTYTTLLSIIGISSILIIQLFIS